MEDDAYSEYSHAGYAIFILEDGVPFRVSDYHDEEIDAWLDYELNYLETGTERVLH